MMKYYYNEKEITKKEKVGIVAYLLIIFSILGYCTGLYIVQFNKEAIREKIAAEIAKPQVTVEYFYDN